MSTLQGLSPNTLQCIGLIFPLIRSQNSPSRVSKFPLLGLKNPLQGSQKSPPRAKVSDRSRGDLQGLSPNSGSMPRRRYRHCLFPIPVNKPNAEDKKRSSQNKFEQKPQWVPVNLFSLLALPFILPRRRLRRHAARRSATGAKGRRRIEKISRRKTHSANYSRK